MAIMTHRERLGSQRIFQVFSWMEHRIRCCFAADIVALDAASFVPGCKFAAEVRDR